MRVAVGIGVGVSSGTGVGVDVGVGVIVGGGVEDGTNINVDVGVATAVGVGVASSGPGMGIRSGKESAKPSSHTIILGTIAMPVITARFFQKLEPLCLCLRRR
ncbi:MAG: hypothetical protein QGI09_01760 [Dehalococcoidia bacterium]|nr:hypothetical protein [Dehalococcoidia bacterium]